MDDSQARDLLIKIDTQNGEIFRRLGDIEGKISSQKCQDHGARIKTLETQHKTISARMWGLVAAVFLIVLKALWPAG